MSLRNRKRQIRNLRDDLAEALAEHRNARDPEYFRQYADDPVGFVREVLEEEPMEWQADALEDLRTENQIAVQSGHALGKDWYASRAALWKVLCRGGLVLVTAPTERQIRRIVFREIAEVWSRFDDLPGTLYKTSLEVSPEAQVIAMTSTAASNLTGYHSGKGVLAFISEAQGVGAHAFNGMMSNTVSEGDTVVCLGNPVAPHGPFYNACTSDAWRVYQLNVFDHPNLRDDSERHIPGGPSRPWLERVRDSWGEGGRQWQSRVLGEFPDSAEDSLYRPAWIYEAMDRHEKGVLDEMAEGGRLVISVDPARFGNDETAIAVREGPVLREIRTYASTSTTEVVARVRDILAEYEIPTVGEYDPSQGERKVDYSSMPKIVVDTVGIGGGVYDQLDDDGYAVVSYKGGARAVEHERFNNTRAESYWHLRKKLEAGAVALPQDDLLLEELVAIKWEEDGRGRVRLPRKSRTAQLIGRSPDRADATVMAFFGEFLEGDGAGIGLWIAKGPRWP